jgi:hypothetical protein
MNRLQRQFDFMSIDGEEMMGIALIEQQFVLVVDLN